MKCCIIDKNDTSSPTGQAINIGV